jgi:hypothetical protein
MTLFEETHRLHHRDDPITAVESAVGRLERKSKRMAQILELVRYRPYYTAAELGVYAMFRFPKFAHCSCCARFEINRWMKALVETGTVERGPVRACRVIKARCLTWKPVFERSVSND